MYIAFGNRVVDSMDMKKLIEDNTEFKVIKDMSKGSKREDIVAFNLSMNIDLLNEELSEEFNTLEKLEAFDLEASTHPLYSEIREDINNARIILEGKALEFTEAKVSNFKSFNDERLASYDELFNQANLFRELVENQKNLERIIENEK